MQLLAFAEQEGVSRVELCHDRVEPVASISPFFLFIVQYETKAKHRTKRSTNGPSSLFNCRKNGQSSPHRACRCTWLHTRMESRNRLQLSLKSENSIRSSESFLVRCSYPTRSDYFTTTKGECDNFENNHFCPEGEEQIILRQQRVIFIICIVDSPGVSFFTKIT